MSEADKAELVLWLPEQLLNETMVTTLKAPNHSENLICLFNLTVNKRTPLIKFLD